jgi:D-lactate dehydrogenase
MKRRAASLLGGRLRGLMASSAEEASTSTGLFGTRSSIGPRSMPAASQQVRHKAFPAQAVATKLQPDVLPLTHTDAVGAISIVEPHEKDFVPKVWENVDGRRIEDGRYAAFLQELTGEWRSVW